MKKSFKFIASVIAIIMLVSPLASCGTSPNQISDTREPGQGKNEDTINTITIISGESAVTPYGSVRFINSYNEQTGYATAADGISAFQKTEEFLKDNEESFPTVNSKSISIDISSNGKMAKLEIYTKNDIEEKPPFELKTSLALDETDIFKNTTETLASLPMGTYYIIIYVTWDHGIVNTPKGEFQNKSGYNYYFKLVI